MAKIEWIKNGRAEFIKDAHGIGIAPIQIIKDGKLTTVYALVASCYDTEQQAKEQASAFSSLSFQ